ncbi:MAG: PQQ-like beta-propeller repeat protein [Gemmatimonadota bacterium]|nr:PQQ-like beta-propeller repeat protein [Gemmatimonadota bacterium]
MSERVPCVFGSPARWNSARVRLDPPLRPAWSLPNDDLVNPVILGDGRAFCVSDPRGLVALDAASGRELWRQETLSGWGSCQLIEGGLLSTLRPGVLTLLDPTSGRELAAYEVTDIHLHYGVVAGNRVVNPFADGSIGVWDLAARTFSWRVPAAWSAKLLATDGQNVCLYERDACVMLDLATGAERWRFDVTELGRHTVLVGDERAGSVVGHPIIAGNCVYIGVTGGWLVALDTASGAVRWKTHVGRIAPNNFALAPNDELLFLGDGALVTLDARTGAIRSRHEFVTADDAIDDGPYAPMAPTERYVWTVDRGGRLVAISRDAGRVYFSVELDGRVASPPSIADGRLFVVDLDGQLTVFASASAEGAA